MRMYGEIIPRFSEGIIDRTGAQTMHYLMCTMIPSVNLAQYGVSCATEWISVDCGTIQRYLLFLNFQQKQTLKLFRQDSYHEELQSLILGVHMN